MWPNPCASTEIPYVFDTVAARYTKNLSPADEAIAKTGNPDGEGRPHWPPYSAQDDQLMNFTNAGPVAERDAWKPRLDLTEAAAQGK